MVEKNKNPTIVDNSIAANPTDNQLWTGSNLFKRLDSLHEDDQELYLSFKVPKNARKNTLKVKVETHDTRIKGNKHLLSNWLVVEGYASTPHSPNTEPSVFHNKIRLPEYANQKGVRAILEQHVTSKSEKQSDHLVVKIQKNRPESEDEQKEELSNGQQNNDQEKQEEAV